MSICSNFACVWIILYGLIRDYMNELPIGIEPVMSWKSVVSMVKDVHPGDTIGYGRTFVVDKPMSIATILQATQTVTVVSFQTRDGFLSMVKRLLLSVVFVWIR